MSDLSRHHAGLSMGEFSFLTDEQKTYLNSLNLKTCDGYGIIFEDAFSLYHEKADIYFLKITKFENPDCLNEHMAWRQKNFGENTFMRIILMGSDIVYFFVKEEDHRELINVELKGVVSKYSSAKDKTWLRKIIHEIVRRKTTHGRDLFYYDKDALFMLLD